MDECCTPGLMLWWGVSVHHLGTVITPPRSVPLDKTRSHRECRSAGSSAPRCGFCAFHGAGWAANTGSRPGPRQSCRRCGCWGGMELDFTGSELWVDFFADYPRCRGCTVGKAPVILKKGHTSPEQSFSIFLHRTETMLIKQKKTAHKSCLSCGAVKQSKSEPISLVTASVAWAKETVSVPSL